MPSSKENIYIQCREAFQSFMNRSIIIREQIFSSIHYVQYTFLQMYLLIIFPSENAKYPSRISKSKSTFSNQ